MPGIRRFWIGVALAGVSVLRGPAGVAAAEAPDTPRDLAISEASPAIPATLPAARTIEVLHVPELETPGSESLVDLELADFEPLPSVSDPEALRAFVESEPAALGPLSIGSPDGGILFNPMAMPEGSLWRIRNPPETFATTETIEFITSAIASVEARHPGSPRLVIGDISRPDGGRLNRHRSHQAGRDADIGFYFRSGEASDFKKPGRDELDVPRTWTFVRALVTDTDIQRIFVDRAVQRVLYAHALAEGEDQEWLDDIFGRRTDGKDAIIQHERRHQDHLHARFYNRSAQERGRVAYPLLVQARLVPGPTVIHQVRSGETLSHLARRYGASAKAIRAANSLRGSALRAGRRYVIPVRKAPDLSDPVFVPPRRLPPAAQAADEEQRPADGGGSLP
jgi:murein endopeptidase